MLTESSIDKNPFLQFEKWYGEAFKLIGEDASTMIISTSLNNQPNARAVYLRGQDKKGYWFFTNYRSRKANEFTQNKKICALFFWTRLFRQVRMHGFVEKLPTKKSNEYFFSRPRESQIGAWASPQSQKIKNRNTLDQLVEQYTKKFEGKKIPRPPHWGGYRFVPTYFEFWYGRESRLHDRIIFTRNKNKWIMERLAP